MRTQVFTIFLFSVFGLTLLCCAKSSGEGKHIESMQMPKIPLRIEKILKNEVNNRQTLTDVTIADNNQYWASGEFLWKTVNRGESWEKISNFESNGGITTVRFSSPNRGLIVLPYSVGETRDGGNNWKFNQFRNFIGGFGITLGNSGKTYLYGKSPPLGDAPGIIYVSSDGSETWKELFDSSTVTDGDYYSNPTSLVEFSIDQLLVYSETGRLLRSENRGVSWQSVQYKNEEIDSLFAGENNQLWGSGVETGIFVSYDKGETWEASRINTSSLESVKWNSICFLNSDLGVAVGNRGKIVVTNNSGKEWLGISDKVLGSDNLIKVTCDSRQALILGTNWLYRLSIGQ